MAAAKNATSAGVDANEVTPLLRAILMVLLERRDGDPKVEPSSVQLLTTAGFTNAQIAELTGRSPDAVRMAINRAKKAPMKKAARGKTRTATEFADGASDA